MYSIRPGHLKDEQQKILRSVALAYRRVMRAPPLEVSGEVNRMIAAAINVDSEWFWHGPDA
jgi:hypothetical protein